MKRALFALVAAVSVTAPAFADQALATSKNCMACHAADKKLVGPAFQDVAKKYAGQKDAPDMLAASIKKGGAGIGTGPTCAQRCRCQDAGGLGAGRRQVSRRANRRSEKGQSVRTAPFFLWRRRGDQPNFSSRRADFSTSAIAWFSLSAS